MDCGRESWRLVKKTLQFESQRAHDFGACGLVAWKKGNRAAVSAWHYVGMRNKDGLRSGVLMVRRWAPADVSEVSLLCLSVGLLMLAQPFRYSDYSLKGS